MSNPLMNRMARQDSPQAVSGSILSALPSAIAQARKTLAFINAAQNPQKALMDYCDKSGLLTGYTGSRNPESMTRWLAQKNGIPLDEILQMAQSSGAQGLGNKLSKLLKGS